MPENGQIIKSKLETAEVLNNFFSNFIKNLEISKFSDYEPYKTLRVILKHRSHPNVIAIQNQFKNIHTFYFTDFAVTDIEKENWNVKYKKSLSKF